MTNYFKIFVILISILFGSAITAKFSQQFFNNRQNIIEKTDEISIILNDNLKSSKNLSYLVTAIAIKDDELILVSILKSSYIENTIAKYKNCDTTFYSCSHPYYFGDYKINKYQYEGDFHSYILKNNFIILKSWFEF